LDQQTGSSKSDSHSQDWAVKRENGSLTREYGGFWAGQTGCGDWPVVSGEEVHCLYLPVAIEK
jgi:hypothetical protein